MHTVKYLILLAYAVVATKALSAEPPTFVFSSRQNISHIRPQHDNLSISVTAKDIADVGPVHLKLFAPPPNPLVSTDFPVVEGSTLIDSIISLDKGGFAFSFVPPIRGTYQLEVATLSRATGLTKQQRWTFTVEENPEKWQNLVIFLLTLGLICGFSGFVVGFSESGNIKSRALLLTCLAFVVFPIKHSWAHDQEKHSLSKENPIPSRVEYRNGLNLELRLLNQSARVGRPAELVGFLRDKSGQLVPARFELAFRQVEHDIILFSTKLLGNGGSFRWSGQFYDGSTHRVEVKAIPFEQESQVVTAVLPVEVEAVAPPANAVSKSFLSLLLFAAVTMILGYGIGSLQRKRAAA